MDRLQDLRREDDDRWLKIQTEMMNLVTAQRTIQQDNADLVVEQQRLVEHLEDIDDHLRGVGGKESLDTRVSTCEHKLEGHTNLLRELSRRIWALEETVKKDLSQIKQEIFSLQYKKSVDSQEQGTKTERLKEWLGFWGAIIGGILAILVPLATLTYEHWDRIKNPFEWKRPANYVDQFIVDLRERRKDPAVKKMLREKYGDGVE